MRMNKELGDLLNKLLDPPKEPPPEQEDPQVSGESRRLVGVIARGVDEHYQPPETSPPERPAPQHEPVVVPPPVSHFAPGPSQEPAVRMRDRLEESTLPKPDEEKKPHKIMDLTPRQPVKKKQETAVKKQEMPAPEKPLRPLRRNIPHIVVPDELPPDIPRDTSFLEERREAAEREAARELLVRTRAEQIREQLRRKREEQEQGEEIFPGLETSPETEPEEIPETEPETEEFLEPEPEIVPEFGLEALPEIEPEEIPETEPETEEFLEPEPEILPEFGRETLPEVEPEEIPETEPETEEFLEPELEMISEDEQEPEELPEPEEIPAPETLPEETPHLRHLPELTVEEKPSFRERIQKWLHKTPPAKADEDAVEEPEPAEETWQPELAPGVDLIGDAGEDETLELTTLEDADELPADAVPETPPMPEPIEDLAEDSYPEPEEIPETPPMPENAEEFPEEELPLPDVDMPGDAEKFPEEELPLPDVDMPEDAEEFPEETGEDAASGEDSLQDAAETSEPERPSVLSFTSETERQFVDEVLPGEQKKVSLRSLLREALDESAEELAEIRAEPIPEVPESAPAAKLRFWRRNSYFVVGILCFLLALVGLVSCVRAGMRWTSRFMGGDSLRSTLEAALYPAVVVDLPAFENVDELPAENALSAAIMDILMYDDLSGYSRSFDMLTIPETDVTDRAERIFGKRYEAGNSLHAAGETFYYDSENSCYNVPASPVIFSYFPEVDSIRRSGDTYVASVRYCSDTAQWQSRSENFSDYGEKTVEVTLEETDDTYRIVRMVIETGKENAD